MRGGNLDLATRLRERFPRLKLTRDFSFARHTTIGCGGSAAASAYPAAAEEAAELLLWLWTERVPHCFLGTGANVLPADGRFEGVVVCFSSLSALYADGTRIYAGAGVTGGRLLSFAAERLIGGLEAFSGIPTSVGGGITMNAGVRELHFSDVTEQVLASEKGKLYLIPQKDCAFSEKESVFQGGLAVLGAYLNGKRSDAATIATEACFYRRRRAALPKGRSMGCAFVNPPGKTAGELIEACGMKNTRVGGARVSDVHANFILNEGGSSDDVSALAELVRARVQMQTGILLREEFRRIP